MVGYLRLGLCFKKNFVQKAVTPSSSRPKYTLWWKFCCKFIFIVTSGNRIRCIHLQLWKKAKTAGEVHHWLNRRNYPRKCTSAIFITSNLKTVRKIQNVRTTQDFQSHKITNSRNFHSRPSHCLSPSNLSMLLNKIIAVKDKIIESFSLIIYSVQ